MDDLDTHPPTDLKIATERYRPEVPDDCDPEVRDCIRSCWSEDPRDRPSAVDLQIRLHCFKALRCGAVEMVEARVARLCKFTDSEDNLLAHELWKKMKASETEISLVKRIGQGACGDVHQGVFRGRDVAVKTFRDDDRRKSFHEIELLFELRHPHIIGLYAWFVTAVSCRLTGERGVKNRRSNDRSSL